MIGENPNHIFLIFLRINNIQALQQFVFDPRKYIYKKKEYNNYIWVTTVTQTGTMWSMNDM